MDYFKKARDIKRLRRSARAVFLYAAVRIEDIDAAELYLSRLPYDGASDKEKWQGEMRFRRRMRSVPKDMICPNCGLSKLNPAEWSAAAGVCRSCNMVPFPPEDYELKIPFIAVSEWRVSRGAIKYEGTAREAARRVGWSEPKMSRVRSGVRCTVTEEEKQKLIEILGVYETGFTLHVRRYCVDPVDLRMMRETFGISQTTMSKRLGWPHGAWTKLEKGLVKSLTREKVVEVMENIVDLTRLQCTT